MSFTGASTKGVQRGWATLAWSVGPALVVCGLMWLIGSQHRLRAAELALSSRDFREALRLAEIAMKSEPDSPQAILIAGYACLGLKQPEIAASYLTRVADRNNLATTLALVPLADLSLRQGHASDAERSLRRVLELDHDHADARDRLIYLLVLEGRIWEAQQFVFQSLQAGRVDDNYLKVTGYSRIELGEGDRFSQACLAAVPDDPLPLLSEARRACRAYDASRGRQLLEQIIATRPEILEAQGLLGTLLAETGDFPGLLRWQAQLPERAEDHPAVWFGRGIWALKIGQRQAAVRCFAETWIRQPNHVAANYQLSQVLAALGHEASALEFGNRARDLSRLEFLMGESPQGWTPEDARQFVQLLQSLGRAWEAAAWCQVALIRDRRQEWPVQKLRELAPFLTSADLPIVNAANLVKRFELIEYPLPDWNRVPQSIVGERIEHGATCRVSFTDESTRLGLHFVYQNGARSDDFESMFEFDGGGVAALDYDGDRWPDLYLTQGGPLPPEASPRREGDRLFRNIAGDQAVDVTSLAGLGDTSYSQGVTAGDFNGDGFQDLYVANIGPNAMFRNNGDGTYTDTTQDSGTAGNDWSSSCGFADVNGDALPDLYVVNYLAGDELWSRPCSRNSRPRCHPSLYRAAQDRLYLNLGDGRFEDVTFQAGIDDAEGRGLGLVAADFDGSGRVSLFVGNDMTRNFLFSNQTASRGAQPRFAEQALLRGVAVDSRGNPKAAMGIAAGDANGDGLLDLFITNFYRESNNLYLQQPDHTFLDATREANLSESGYYNLGWGAQFLDGELDGHPDLILVNGHVHVPSEPTVPYRMQPQYLQNSGNGRFVEISAQLLGEFFQQKALGRSLARLDWNRDGLEEACVSHLDSPAALLLNRTTDHGHFVAVSLVGTESDRDAVGATVDVVTGGRVLRSQLTSGDGYQASNQRRLVFGLAKAERILRIDVHWPAGTTQSFQDPAIDCEWILIEGRPLPFNVTP